MIVDILEEHLDEADYLFSQRLFSMEMLDIDNEDMGKLDDRLRAHLEGLVLGGDDAWGLIAEGVEEGTVSQAFVAAIVAMEGEEPFRLEALEQVLERATPEIFEGVRWACCLTVWPGVAGFAKHLMGSESPQAKALAIESMTHLGIDPGQELGEALKSSTQVLLLAGLWGVGRLGARRCLQAVWDYAAMGEPMVQAAALESLAVLEPQTARRCCLDIIKAAGPCTRHAVGVLGVLGNKQDLGLLIQMMNDPNARVARAAMLAVGGLGEVSGVPALITMLEHEKLGGVAGFALGKILGDGLPDEEAVASDVLCDSEENQDSEAEGEAETESEEEDWEPDDDLPMLSSEAVKAWWAKEQGRFPAGVRYRFGETYQPGPMQTAMLGFVSFDTLG